MDDEVRDALAAAPVVAIVRLADAAPAEAVASALHQGGIRLVEVTLTTAGALRAVERLVAAAGDRLPGLVVGVGSVRTPDQARQAGDAGARFLVTPTTRPDVLAASAVPVVCGGLTPTELDAAAQAGAPWQKLFPASAVGPSYVREVLAPMPDLRLVPTGGINPGNVAAYRAAGAVAVAAGSALVDAATVGRADWPALTGRAREFLAAWHGSGTDHSG